MTTFAHDQLRSFVERIERLDEDGKAISNDKRDIYAEAKSNGFDVKALKTVIARRRKDHNELQEQDALVELYTSQLGTADATRAGVKEAA